MSRDFDDRNRGQIWKNEKKSSDKHPDFTGSLNVDGKEYWVSAWRRKEGANPRSPALSFSVKPKDGQEPRHNESSNKPSATTRRGSMKDAFEDDIPFAPEFR